MIDDISGDLDKLLKGEISAGYLGGTLALEHYWVNISGQSVTFLRQDPSMTMGRKMSNKEMFLACKIYIKHKQPSASFYTLAAEFIASYEAERLLLAGTDSI